MILEIATIDVKPGQEGKFERGVAEAVAIFRRAKGYRSLKLERSIDIPSRYQLVVGWDSVEDHVVAFRNSSDFQAWRSLVGDAFARPPIVDHVAVVLVDP